MSNRPEGADGDKEVVFAFEPDSVKIVELAKRLRALLHLRLNPTDLIPERRNYQRKISLHRFLKYISDLLGMTKDPGANEVAKWLACMSAMAENGTMQTDVVDVVIQTPGT